jgi:hypothetical protein
MASWSYNKTSIINSLIWWLKIINRKHGFLCWANIHSWVKGEMPTILHTYGMGKMNNHFYKKCRYCDVIKLSRALPDGVSGPSDAEMTEQIKKQVCRSSGRLGNRNVPYGVFDWDKECGGK